MTIEFLSQYWALVGAGTLALFVAVFVAVRVHADSARGQLRARVRDLRRRYRELVAAARTTQRAEAKLGKLESRRAAVKPRHLQEAKEALQDAHALEKIAQDQVLIAENHVRKIIVEEYPPRRHDTLRERYLARPEPDGKPFTF